MRLPSRLTLQIYLVSIVQLLVVIGAVALIGWLTFRGRAPAELHGESRFAIETVARERHDPARMRHEADRVLKRLRGKLTLYAEDGSVLVSNVSPPLPHLAASELVQLRDRGELLRHGHPPLLALRLAQSSSGIMYGLFVPGRRPPPPPLAVWGITVALLAAAGAAVILARSLAKPLRRLTAAARVFGAGDMTVRVHMRRRDEFGELADAFDEMADRVEQLLRSQQQLMADVSHELRTPLARIRVALDLASEGDAAMARTALSEISGDLAELERLIADVLQTARLDLASGRAAGAPPLRAEPIELSALIERASARFGSLHPQRRLERSLAAPLPTLRGDPTLLRRALDNLLDNAAAYSESDQPVTLSIARTPEFVELCVEDRGIGIAPEHLAHIGRPFYRTDRSRARRTGGLGLGVSLSRRIAEAHGGTLTIESELGVGTRARLRLPLRRASGAAP
ncbi:MAG TPA: ATP-binding protein [Polyangiales bacterium]